MAPSQSAATTSNTTDTKDWRSTALVLHPKFSHSPSSGNSAREGAGFSLGTLLTYGAGLLSLGAGLALSLSPETFDTSEDGTCLGVATETLGKLSGLVGAGLLGWAYLGSSGGGEADDENLAGWGRRVAVATVPNQSLLEELAAENGQRVIELS